MRWYLKVLRTWSLEGRASRSELWMFLLIDLVVMIVLRAVDQASGLTWGPHGSQGFAFSFYALVVALPTIGVQIRRLHDIGKSGWYVLAAFIPIIGGFMLLYWYVQESEPRENAYGANPNAAGAG
ncbi:MAG TPA: DUF805 domain-containing protein [Polyangiaceae bacterium]|nr:DUF805 domain-containing protein [Polyangiaceae bacterium]